MTIEQILEAIKQIKVLELNELVKACRRKIRCICFSSSNAAAGAAAGSCC